MRKQFDNWYKIRHNVVECHLADDTDAVVLVEYGKIGSAIGTGLGALAGGLLGGGIPGAIAGGAIGAGLGGAGGAAAWAGEPWGRQKWNRFTRARTRTSRDPVDYDDALGNADVDSGIQHFADNLGLSPRLRNQPYILRSLQNIYLARIFGPKYATIQEGDLASIWQAISQPVIRTVRGTGRRRRMPSIAQQQGIPRPFAIISKVPGIRPGVKYHITRDAVDYDRSIIAQQASAGREEPERLGRTPPPTSGVGLAVSGGGGGMPSGMMTPWINHILTMPVPGRHSGGGSPPTARQVIETQLGSPLTSRQLRPQNLIRVLDNLLSGGGSGPGLDPREERLLQHVRNQLASLSP